MRNINTFSKSEYIWWNLYLGAMAYFPYRFWCLNYLSGLSVFSSKMILLLLVVTFIPLGVLITQRRRNTVSLIVNVAMPFELYTLAILYKYLSVYNIIVLSVTAVLTLAYLGFVMAQKIKGSNRRRVIIRRIKFASLGMRTVLGICLLAVLLPYSVKTTFGYGILNTKAETKVAYEPDKWFISNHMETLIKLKDEEWNKLNTNQKLDILGVIKNIEMSYFGIPHEVYLEADKMDSQNTLGYYNSREHKIVINIDWLAKDEVSGEDALGVILHESYHVYEKACISAYQEASPEYKNLLMFYNASLYEEGFKNYINAEDDYVGYAIQDVEFDADRYSDSVTEEYFSIIDEYLEENENEQGFEELNRQEAVG